MERFVLIRNGEGGKPFVIKTIQNADGSYREPRENEILEDLHKNDVARMPGLTWKDKQANFVRQLRSRNQGLKEKEWADGETESYDRFVEWKERANMFDGNLDRMQTDYAKSEENLRNDDLTPSMRAKIRSLSSG